MSSGVRSKSPVSSDSESGFGDAALKGCVVAGSVLAHVRSRFGSVTRRSAEAL